MFHVRQTTLNVGDILPRYDLDVRAVSAPYWASVLHALPDPVVFRDQLAGVPDRSLKGNLAIEAVLEHVRANQFGQLPSRVDCAFGGETVVDVLRFAWVYRVGGQVNLFYEVQPLGDVYHADMAYVNRGYEHGLDPLTALNRQRQRALRYWQSVAPGPNPAHLIPEVLMVGGATILAARPDLQGPF